MRRQTRRKPPRSSRSRTRPHRRACSCSRRWPTSCRGSSRRVGARRSTRHGAGRSGSKAQRPSGRSEPGTRGAAAGGTRTQQSPKRLSPGSAWAALSRPPRRSGRARRGRRGRRVATPRPQPAPCRGRRARRRRPRRDRPGWILRRSAGGRPAGGSPRRRNAGRDSRHEPEAAGQGCKARPDESVVPVSNQHSDPADKPVITTPDSHAVRSARSTPWTRQTASMFSVLPPPT